MCDQTEVSYLEDDIVWVKIGPIWWPGVVKDLEKDDEGKEILAALKKKPIAAVKFFQEDNYEFVKNLDSIYHYNCRRKDEFIKKGLDKFRTGATHMKKFPSDVTTAESLTHGDVNIINDPKFLPEKKESYSEIFGSGKKKTKKGGESPSRSKGPRSSTSLTPYRPITHQRFINKVLHGESDHRVKTLIQTNSSADDNASKNPYKCHICKFETSRVNVIVAHHRLSHSSKNSINWTGSENKISRKKPINRSRKLKTKKLFDTSKEDDSDDDGMNVKVSPKGRAARDKGKSPKKMEIEKTASPSLSKRKSKEFQSPGLSGEGKKPRYTDVLLADWNEDEDEDKKDKDDINNGTEISDSKTGDQGTTKLSHEANDSSTDTIKQTEKMSCFDFDEEEDGFIGMSNASTYGRKIPRVIPVKDKAELGVDADIDELFKKKDDDEGHSEGNAEQVNEECEKEVSKSTVCDERNIGTGSGNGKPNATAAKRRKSKGSKEEEPKIDQENSLALRRTRRPGAKKSYLNEVIEKIDEEEEKNEANEKKEDDPCSEEVKTAEGVKCETGSQSSRRKQDFKNQTIDINREEMVYSDIVKSEQKPKCGDGNEKKKGKRQQQQQQQQQRKETKDDFTAQIDSLLEETKPSQLPEAIEPCVKPEEEGNNDKTNNFSFDYVPNESSGKKFGRARSDVKSISRMFGDSMPNSNQGSGEESQVGGVETSEGNTIADGGRSKTLQAGNGKVQQGSSLAFKRGSIVLTTASKNSDSPLKMIPKHVGATSNDSIVLPGEKQVEGKDEQLESDSGRIKNIKTIKVKSDSLPSTLLGSGKLKGQTIIHQKSGKFVIVTQPPQAGRHRVTPGKVQSGNKVVILTNQHGEQKIITTGGLQQSKFKVEAGDSVTEKESSQSQNQPVIKMVPDGKGGIMKQLTVSPKKVLLGGTKMLVSGPGSTFSSGNNVQKIALSGSGGSTRAGDFRLIENYKGSGKTVLIQSTSNSTGGVVLPRQVTKVVQSSQAIPALKKKPKILMRASTGMPQGEYVVQSGTGELPAYVVKQKGADGKFSTQKIVRTDVLNQAKVSPSTAGAKGFILSGQSNKKGESYIIATNDAVSSKVIRMRQKIKSAESPTAPKISQKILTKGPEIYAVAKSSIILPSQDSGTSETTQILQVQDPSAQQPVIQTQVIAMPGPVGTDGNQTYVLVSVDENGVVQSMDNSVVAYDASAQQDQIFLNATSTGNVVLLNPQVTEETTPVFSTSSQDILAEALANTNVLEGSLNNEIDSVVPSILLPPSIPSSVVQETSITLQKPIMTPVEMPSSVAPDTSGLEPPPLPPTPTNDDVLMEEAEMTGAEAGQREGKETCSEDTIQPFMQHSYEVVGEVGESGFLVTSQPKEGFPLDESQKPETLELVARDEFKSLVRDELVLENPQEGSAPSSFQSMPLLSDEPDTSDDAQSDQQQSKIQAAREQEPPSSTINEANGDQEMCPKKGSQETLEVSGCGKDGHEPKVQEEDEQMISDENDDQLHQQQQQQQQQQQKEVGKESHSMPIIADDTNAVEIDYSDVVMSQKRFQEETEVSSTTDEFASKSSITQ